jgi:hypothetical protein
MEHVSLRSSLRERTRALHARLDTALTGPEGRVADVPGPASSEDDATLLLARRL